MKITVGVSNRHVHLSKETYSLLFGEKELEVRNDLKQTGEFASTDTVSVKYGDITIENVRILGPFRDRNQIELLQSDLDRLGLEAPVRRSGELDNTPQVKLIVNGREVITDGVIKAERHVHISTSESEEWGWKDRDRVLISSGMVEFDAHVKVSRLGVFELHIDKDEASEFGLQNGDEVELTYVENR